MPPDRVAEQKQGQDRLTGEASGGHSPLGRHQGMQDVLSTRCVQNESGSRSSRCYADRPRCATNHCAPSVDRGVSTSGAHNAGRGASTSGATSGSSTACRAQGPSSWRDTASGARCCSRGTWRAWWRPCAARRWPQACRHHRACSSVAVACSRRHSHPVALPCATTIPQPGAQA